MIDIKDKCQAVLAHVINYYRATSDDDSDLQTKIASLPGNTTLEELALDDLDLMDFVYRIEDQLQIQLDDRELTLRTDLDTAFNLVRDAIKRKQAA